MTVSAGTPMLAPHRQHGDLPDLLVSVSVRYRLRFASTCTFSRRCTPLRRRVCRIPQTTTAAVHIVSSINIRTDTNDGQTANPPATLAAFAIVSTVPAKITSIRNTVERGKRNWGCILNLRMAWQGRTEGQNAHAGRRTAVHRIRASGS